jgi:hypothetical protein
VRGDGLRGRVYIMALFCVAETWISPTPAPLTEAKLMRLRRDNGTENAGNPVKAYFVFPVY